MDGEKVEPQVRVFRVLSAYSGPDFEPRDVLGVHAIETCPKSRLSFLDRKC